MRTVFVRSTLAFVAGLALALMPAASLADFIDLPIKWSQPVVVGGDGFIIGADLSSDDTVPTVKADDFISDGRPIVAVRWWGSYIGDLTHRPDTFTGPFHISFHLSDANPPPLGTGAPHPTSLPMPGDPLVLYDDVTAQQVFVGFDHPIGGPAPFEAVYRYDAYLPTPFPEQAGVEYFIDIDKPTGEEWGWHFTPIHNLDWAAQSLSHAGPWGSLNGTDLAFELMVGVPEPNVLLLLALGSGVFIAADRRRNRRD